MTATNQMRRPAISCPPFPRRTCRPSEPPQKHLHPFLDPSTFQSKFPAIQKVGFLLLNRNLPRGPTAPKRREGLIRWVAGWGGEWRWNLWRPENLRHPSSPPWRRRRNRRWGGTACSEEEDILCQWCRLPISASSYPEKMKTTTTLHPAAVVRLATASSSGRNLASWRHWRGSRTTREESWRACKSSESKGSRPLPTEPRSMPTLDLQRSDWSKRWIMKC